MDLVSPPHHSPLIQTKTGHIAYRIDDLTSANTCPQQSALFNAPLLSSRSSQLPCSPVRTNAMAPAPEFWTPPDPPFDSSTKARRCSDIRAANFETFCLACWASTSIRLIGCSLGANLRLRLDACPLHSLPGCPQYCVSFDTAQLIVVF